MDTKVIKYPSGLNLVYHKNKSKQAVYLEFRFKAGLWNDPMDKLGLAHFMEHALAFSNDEYTMKQKTDYRKNLYYHNFTTNGEYIRVYGYVSDEEFEELFKTYSNYLSSFNIKEEEFENERKVIEQEIKRRRINLADEMFYLSRTSKYKKLEPYNHISAAGTVETLSNITKGDITNYTKKVFALNNCQITVYGNVRLSKVKKLINKHVLPNFEKHTDDKFIGYYNLADKLSKPNIFISASPDGDRSKIKCEFAFEAPKYDRLNYYALDLINQIYTFTAYKFFRDKYGLTYNSTLNFRGNLDPLANKLYLYSSLVLDCDQSNIKKTLEILPEFFNYLKEFPITDESIKEARIYFKRYAKARPTRNYVTKGEEKAERFFDYGFFYTDKQNKKYKKQCNKMKEGFVKNILKQIFSVKPYIFIVSNTTDELPKYADLRKQIKKNLAWVKND